MRIAVVSEISAADKNPFILSALEGRGHTITNAGMRNKEDKPGLLYTHTGFISALLVQLGEADLVVGGCGTGQGFLNSVMQYPGMMCGHILTPLDAWLFTQINSGNCVSLALNQGFGWAGEINLSFLFDRLFSTEWGSGFPKEREAPQKEAREDLHSISVATHRAFPDILLSLPEKIVKPALEFLVGRKIVDLGSPDKREIRDAIKKRL